MTSTVFEREPPASAVIDASLASSKNLPFWIDDIGTARTHEPLNGEDSTDLTIVGGGFLGLWSALMATERDPQTRVIVIDAGRIGHAASGRNGGFCEASLTHGHENAHKHWPEDEAQLEAMGLTNLREFEETLARYGIDCDFERTGTLSVAVEPYQARRLAEKGGWSADEVQAQIASPTFLAGVWHRDDCALLHPAKLTAGLARVCVERGVRFFERSPVLNLKASGDLVRVECASGSVVSRRVILATNAFPSLIKRYRRHTLPVYDYVLMTETLTDVQMTSIGWRHRQGVADLANQFHYYRLTRDNRILFGGYDAVYHFGGRVRSEYEERPETFRRLASHFFTTFPQLAGLRFSHRWAGVIDTSSRFCAFFGSAFNGQVVHAAGFTGLGVGATRFAANVLLDQVFGLDTPRTRLQMTRELPMAFPPEPIAYATIRMVQSALARADRREGRRGPLLRVMDALGFGFDS